MSNDNIHNKSFGGSCNSNSCCLHPHIMDKEQDAEKQNPIGKNYIKSMMKNILRLKNQQMLKFLKMKLKA